MLTCNSRRWQACATYPARSQPAQLCAATAVAATPSLEHATASASSFIQRSFRSDLGEASSIYQSNDLTLFVQWLDVQRDWEPYSTVDSIVIGAACGAVKSTKRVWEIQHCCLSDTPQSCCFLCHPVVMQQASNMCAQL